MGCAWGKVGENGCPRMVPTVSWSEGRGVGDTDTTARNRTVVHVDWNARRRECFGDTSVNATMASAVEADDRLEEFNEHFLDRQERLDSCCPCSVWLKLRVVCQ